MSRRNKRKQGFHGGSEYARRSAVGAATQFHHELNHGETGKTDPLWGRGTVVLERPIHGGFGGQFMEVWVRFMEVWIHGGFSVWGARNSAPPWTGTHTLAAAGFREPKRLKSFGQNLLQTEQFCFMKVGLTWAGLA